MVLSDGNSQLDYLFQKSLRYNHHRENYQISIRDGIIPPGLQIKKEPAFVPVTDDFHRKWKSVLYDAEKRLVKLLLTESEKVITGIEIEFDQQLERQYPDYAEQKKVEIVTRHQSYRNRLSQKRKKKWSKFSTQNNTKISKNVTSEQQPNKSTERVNIQEEISVKDQNQQLLVNHNITKLIDSNITRYSSNETSTGMKDSWKPDNRVRRKKKTFAQIVVEGSEKRNLILLNEILNL